MSLDDVSSLSPLHFFAYGADCYELQQDPLKGFEKGEIKELSRHPEITIPVSETILSDKVSLKLGWHPEGIAFLFESKVPFRKSVYPDLEKGDSLEFFFDTRDLKTTGFNTRFCHHFFFLPEPFESLQKGEITRFRTEDRHDLIDPEKLLLKTKKERKGFTLLGYIPKQALHGYNPEEFPRLGFAYRFSLAEYQQENYQKQVDISQHPSLWHTLNLKK